jgi:alanyl-tRNA synthetase
MEFWNLVFPQFDAQPGGGLVPLLRPGIDTGMGLERLAMILQNKLSIFETDLFAPLLETVLGLSRSKHSPAAMRDARIVADHVRALVFAIGEGALPGNEGAGYVLRRILRRAVRHAWLLGRTEPTLVYVVQAVIDTMSDVYLELRQRATLITDTTRAEEERFLDTIGGGMQRFEQLAPASSTQGSTAIRGTISGEDAFRLYDTYGFPIDLTELMARERGYTVDIAGADRRGGRRPVAVRWLRHRRDRDAGHRRAPTGRGEGRGRPARDAVLRRVRRADL